MRALKFKSCTAISRAAGVVQKPMSSAVPLPTSIHGKKRRRDGDQPARQY